MVKEWNKMKSFFSFMNADLRFNMCIKGKRFEGSVT